MVTALTRAMPLFVPAIVVATAAAVVLWIVVRRRGLPAPAWLAWSLWAVAVALSATVLPSSDELMRRTCALSMTVPRATELLTVGQESLNIALFVPLGLGVGLAPPTWRARAGLAALSLPVAVELTQYLVPSIGRSCQIGDVVLNVVGIVIGAAAGLATARRR